MPVKAGDLDQPRLVSVELMRVSVPLRSVHRSAKAVSATRESIIVRVSDDSGATGISECPTLGVPGYVTETTDQAWSALRLPLGAIVARGTPCTGSRAPAASAAMVDADLDARLCRRGVSLAEHLLAATARSEPSGVLSGAVQWCAVIADVALTPAEAAQAAMEAVKAGASMLKFKFADPSRLREVVAAVRGTTEVSIAADANGSLTSEAARALDDLGLSYLEQPLADGSRWGELRGSAPHDAHPGVQRRVTPIARRRGGCDHGRGARCRIDQGATYGRCAQRCDCRTAVRRARCRLLRRRDVRARHRTRCRAVGCGHARLHVAHRSPGRAHGTSRATCATRWWSTATVGWVVPLGVGIGRTLDEEVLADHLVDAMLLERGG
ncbi:MAG: hypothetical protein M5U19_16295 [Microthrixaceae bacterium]|nr:hypothetical protein [Microthrixaceae bacterium]